MERDRYEWQPNAHRFENWERNMARQLMFGPDGLVLYGRDTPTHQEEMGAAVRAFTFAVVGQDAPLGQTLFGLIQEAARNFRAQIVNDTLNLLYDVRGAFVDLGGDVGRDSLGIGWLVDVIGY